MNRAGFAQAALLRPRIAICVGSGGVGKTTVAAALALEAARRGRRTLVITIDPARRLADALGVRALGNQPEAIPREALAALGVPPQASLSALMLDMKRTFDDLVERFAESADTRARILQNPIYQHVSEALAGSIEYSAMEKVYELDAQRAYDLIVVDTPPSQHALDFLEAPPAPDRVPRQPDRAHADPPGLRGRPLGHELRRLHLGPVRARGHAGLDVAHVHTRHVDAPGCELKPQRVGGRPERGLGCAVDTDEPIPARN